MGTWGWWWGCDDGDGGSGVIGWMGWRARNGGVVVAVLVVVQGGEVCMN